MVLVNIPEQRKAVLIGKEGKTKKKIEHLTGARIFVGAEIQIDGDPENQLKTSEIIKAIGRGFSPEIALKLMDEDFQLDVINIKGSPNTIKRLLSRVIGTNGKAKKNIENLTGASIAVYGKTVSIIGDYKHMENARVAIEMLLAGRKHTTVWRYMENITKQEV